MPLVSVIMPAYNAGPFIAQAIESVGAQDFHDWELIIVNDGSKDNTEEIAGAFTKKDTRIKLLNRENGRQGRARNEAIKFSTGRYLAFLDADDWWVPGKLTQQLDFINQTGADLVFADGFLYKDGETMGVMGSAIGRLEGEAAIAAMLVKNRIPILTVLVKREAVEKVGGFSEAMPVQNAEDYHLWLSLLAHGYICWGAGTQLAYYRLHPHNATSNAQQAFWPVCYALSILGKNNSPHANLFTTALALQCHQWLQQAGRLGDQHLQYGLRHLAQLDIGLPSFIVKMGLKARLPLSLWRRSLKLFYA